MTRNTLSRVKYLKLALQEANRVGDEQAVKRLTKLLRNILAPAQERKSA